MLSAIIKAIQQLWDPGTKKVFFISVGASLLLSITVWIIVTYALIATSVFETLWLDWFVDFLGSSFAFVLTCLLFPCFISIIIGFFLERIADAVDVRYYPTLKVFRTRTMSEVIIQT